jgi:hypothetical protein
MGLQEQHILATISASCPSLRASCRHEMEPMQEFLSTVWPVMMSGVDHVLREFGLSCHGLSREQQHMVANAHALALRPCSFLGCTGLSSVGEKEMGHRRCGSCGIARYCCSAHQRADWRSHKPACRLLQAMG